MNDQFRAIDQIKATSVDMLLKFGPKILVAAAIIIAGHFVARAAGRMVGKLLSSFHVEAAVRMLLVRVSYLLVLSVFVIMALQNLGVQLLPLIAGLGVAGAGIALAMQGLLGNIVAGLTIIFTRPFVTGDYISISKEEGEVLDITLFNTTLGHADRSRVVIPNRKIVGEILHNYGKMRQLPLSVRVAYESDLELALETIREVLRSNSRILQDPVPVVGISRLADFSVVINVNPWAAISDVVSTSAEVNKAILMAFREKGVTIPKAPHDIRIPVSG